MRTCVMEKPDPGTQLTLTGDTQPTQVGHQAHDRYGEYVGRADSGEGHMLNTDIGEPGWLGNPYPKAEYGRAECVEKFRVEFDKRLSDNVEFREAVAQLKGTVLACHCQRLGEDNPLCHAEVIAKRADELG